MKRNVLKIEFDYDFKLIGIACNLKAYKLCWLVNQRLELNLERVDDLEIDQPKSLEKGFFQLYQDDQELENLNYFLIQNNNQGKLYLPELKQLDFLLVIKGSFEFINHQELISTIKDFKGVQTAIELDPSTLKNKQNLIFE